MTNTKSMGRVYENYICQWHNNPLFNYCSTSIFLDSFPMIPNDVIIYLFIKFQNKMLVII